MDLCSFIYFLRKRAFIIHRHVAADGVADRVVRFLVIDITAWTVWDTPTPDVYDDKFYAWLKQRSNQILTWMAQLLRKYPKVRKASVLMNRDKSHLHKMTMNHVFTSNKLNVNLTPVMKTDQTKQLQFAEYKIKRGWNTCINGAKTLIAGKVEKEVSVEEDSDEFYNPMSNRNPFAVRRVAVVSMDTELNT